MKLLIVTGIFPPDSGGPASYVPRIAAELVRRGHGVAVICWSDRLDHDDTEYPFSVHRIRRGGFRPWRNFSTVLNIARGARDKDLIYVNGLAFESMLAARLTRRSTVHKVVGDYAWERARNREWFKGTLDEYQLAPKKFRFWLLDWIRTCPLRRADRIIVPSEYLKRIVSGWGPFADRTQVIYNAVDEQHAPSSSAQRLPVFSGKTLITICRLVPWKGVDQLVQLVAQVADTRLVVVGEGTLRAKLEQQAHQLGIHDRVLFLGQVPQADVAGYLSQANVFVLNSTYEGLPHVVLEAMAAGVPVVATDAGGTNEIVRNLETGILVPVGDERALRAAIIDVLNDKILANRLRSGATGQLEKKFVFGNMQMETETVLLRTASELSQS